MDRKKVLIGLVCGVGFARSRIVVLHRNERDPFCSRAYHDRFLAGTGPFIEQPPSEHPPHRPSRGSDETQEDRN